MSLREVRFLGGTSEKETRLSCLVRLFIVEALQLIRKKIAIFLE
jgi:hypothetical protein